MASISLAGGKPSFNHYPHPGYVEFKDDSQSVIWSDGIGVYKDCYHGGTDMVEVNIWDDGTFQGLRFYTGVMQIKFNDCDFGEFSPRRVNFNFNVSGVEVQTGIAARDILRWYKDAGNYIPRNTTGYIGEGLHAIMYLYRTGHAWIKFLVDPESKTNPGSTLAITQTKVNSFYGNDTDKNYVCTDGEPASYVLYTLDYGQKGVDVQPVGSDGVTWVIKTQARGPGDPVRLYVTDKKNGKAIYLASYPNLPFELTVWCDPFTNPAPAKVINIPTLWGEIKGK